MRQGLIRAMDRCLETKFPTPIYDLIARAPFHQYGTREQTRTTGMRMAWFPRNDTVGKAMFWQAKKVFNETRYDHMSTAGMSKKQKSFMVKNMLTGHYGNHNV